MVTDSGVIGVGFVPGALQAWESQNCRRKTWEAAEENVGEPLSLDHSEWREFEEVWRERRRCS